MEKYNKVQTYLNNVPFMDYSKTSRIHKLKTYQFPNSEVYVKRDDELGFGVSGSKLRKYLSLIPFLKKENYSEVIIWGGAFSNNILSAVQLLKENNIIPILFFDKRNQEKPTGNFLLTSIFIEKQDIHWLNKLELNEKNKLIEKYILDQKTNGINVGLIREGANMYESFPGACTLAMDILRNEKEHSLLFDHIIIDSGTGLTAISLIIIMSYLKLKKNIHVLLVAGNQKEFEESLVIYKEKFEYSIQEKMNGIQNFSLYFPKSAKSFGSVNSSVIKNIKFIAQNEGILTDPIYSSKLFLEARNIILDNKLNGKILLIHSGGSLTLFGFEKQLQKLVE